MILCSCNVISDKAVMDVLSEHGSAIATPLQAYRSLGHSPKCGRCLPSLSRLIDEHQGQCGGDCGACVGDMERPALMAAE
jgi:bacterioferritin-associated ferredoxin